MAKSPVLTVRHQIRANKKLNAMLYQHRQQLIRIYNQYKHPKRGFAIEEAYQLLNTQGIQIGELEDDQLTHIVDDADREEKVGQAQELLKTIPEGELVIIGSEQLKQCFYFSQMTVIDEDMNLQKYKRLLFIEFLEMLSRVAIEGCPNDTDGGTDERKVYELIRILYYRRYESGVDTRDTCPLHAYDVNLGEDLDDSPEKASDKNADSESADEVLDNRRYQIAAQASKKLKFVMRRKGIQADIGAKLQESLLNVAKAPGGMSLFKLKADPVQLEPETEI